MFTILDHLSLALLRLCKNRTTLQCALVLAKRQHANPILLTAIHDSLVKNDTLAAQLDPIVDTLSDAPIHTQP